MNNLLLSGRGLSVFEAARGDYYYIFAANNHTVARGEVVLHGAAASATGTGCGPRGRDCSLASLRVERLVLSRELSDSANVKFC